MPFWMVSEPSALCSSRWWQSGFAVPAGPSPRPARRAGTPRVASGSSAILGQARADVALFDVECRTLVGLGVEPALADLFAAIAQARADFALRQRDRKSTRLNSSH